jgi:hypothetical protein
VLPLLDGVGGDQQCIHEQPQDHDAGFLQYRCWAWNHLPDLVYESRKETTSKWLSHSAASTVLGDSIKQVVSCGISFATVPRVCGGPCQFIRAARQDETSPS